MSKTYDNLYEQVVTEINKRIASSNASSATSSILSYVTKSSASSTASTSDVSDALTSLLNDLAVLIEPHIISGFDVEILSGYSRRIKIYDKSTVSNIVGYATSKSCKWTISSTAIDEDGRGYTTVDIPLDSVTSVYYVIVDDNAVSVSTSKNAEDCSICKIIVPQPGTTSRIVNDKPLDGYDAYIISAKENIFGEDTEFDDTSIEKLRDIIGDVLADNLIGNIKLSENLTITNTQGTLKFNSNSLEFYNRDVDTLLADFTPTGVSFYNNSRIAITKFGVDEAYIGNILITENSIKSRDFSSGETGFRIKDDGNAEFNNVVIRGTVYADAGDIGGILISETGIQSPNFSSGSLGSGFQILANGNAEFNNIVARGKISTSIFEKTSISAVSGNLLVMDSDLLAQDMSTDDDAIEFDFFESYTTDLLIRTAFVTSATNSNQWRTRSQGLGLFYQGIYDICIFNNKIYAVMSATQDLYEWDGISTWVLKASNATTHTESSVGLNKLIVYKDELYAASGSAYTTLLKFTGDAWSEVTYYASYGALGTLRDLIVFDEHLYAGTSSGYLLLWDEVSAWESKADPINSQGIMSLVEFDSKIYAGTNYLGNLQEWNGVNAWTKVAEQINDSEYIRDLCVFNSKLYGCSEGGFLYEWNGVNEWVAVASPYLGSHELWCLIEFDGKLYAGAGNTSIANSGLLLQWDEVSAFEVAVNGSVARIIHSVVEYNNLIYAGAYYTTSETYYGGFLYEWTPDLIANVGTDYVSQGFRSLKATATTASLGDTLTHTISPPINLSTKNILRYDILALRTGSNIKLSFHNSNGYTIEVTPNILISDEFQTEIIDLSVVTAVNKNAIDELKIEVLNSTDENTFYIDNIYAHIDVSGSYTAPLVIKGEITLSKGDIVRIKDTTDDEWMQVVDDSQAPIYAVERDKGSNYAANSNPKWTTGVAIVNYGSANKGGVYISASESNAPYISVITHTGEPWNEIITTARIGNLNGFLGYTSDAFGFAVGDENSYIKYDITNGLRILDAEGFGSALLENRTTDPIGPELGRMWLRTDL